MSRYYRPPQREDPEPYWQPIRFVQTGVPCSFCGYAIAKGKPGTRTGERGTKAYFNRLTREFECIGCREEAGRANLAREAEAAA